jgi:ferredoxin-NADP reductase
MKQNLKLVSKERIARDTMILHWEKPEGFEFTAGQSGKMTLVDPPETDDEGNSRTLSLCSAPHETTLAVATRLRDSAFKRSLEQLSSGAEATLNGPHGDFTLHKTQSTPAVFVIGGIGITPIRSMIAHATHEKLPHEMTLLYSNTTPEDAAFIEELEGFAKENPNFTFVPVYTQVSETEWSGERGHIDAEMLTRHVPDIEAPIYYLSGPPGMVQAMREMLVEAGANEDKIRSEEFGGY